MITTNKREGEREMDSGRKGMRKGEMERIWGEINEEGRETKKY